MKYLTSILITLVPVLLSAQECPCDLFIDGPDTICEGDVAELTVRTSDTTLFVLTWLTTNEGTRTIRVSEPGRYEVLGLFDSGCLGYATKIIGECGSPGPRIYPNPNSGVFIVDNASEVTVFDVTGRQIRSYCGPEIDISEYPNGYYVVKADDTFHTVVVAK